MAAISPVAAEQWGMFTAGQARRLVCHGRI